MEIEENEETIKGLLVVLARRDKTILELQGRQQTSEAVIADLQKMTNLPNEHGTDALTADRNRLLAKVQGQDELIETQDKMIKEQEELIHQSKTEMCKTTANHGYDMRALQDLLNLRPTGRMITERDVIIETLKEEIKRGVEMRDEQAKTIAKQASEIGTLGVNISKALAGQILYRDQVRRAVDVLMEKNQNPV